jgi:hypothetical protein
LPPADDTGEEKKTDRKKKRKKFGEWHALKF